MKVRIVEVNRKVKPLVFSDREGDKVEICYDNKGEPFADGVAIKFVPSDDHRNDHYVSVLLDRDEVRQLIIKLTEFLSAEQKYGQPEVKMVVHHHDLGDGYFALPYDACTANCMPLRQLNAPRPETYKGPWALEMPHGRVADTENFYPYRYQTMEEVVEQKGILLKQRGPYVDGKYAND